MKKEDSKKQAHRYNELNWTFSSSILWKKISSENPTSLNLFQYADQLRLSGKYIESEEVYKKIDIQQIPSNSRFCYYATLGLLYQDQGKMEQAIQAFKESVRSGTEETYPYIFLAVALTKQSKIDEAENLLLEALTKNGDIDEVYCNLSTIYAQKGDFPKAIKAMKKCLKIDPLYPNAGEHLADFKNIVKKFKEK